MPAQARYTVFFSGLNELRAFAAIAVIFHHVELYYSRLSLPSLYDVAFFNPFITNLGKNGVFLFFTLSGFLITYLLLEEKAVTNTISVGKFYGRRILRIWPLYFIIVLIGFVLLPWLYHTIPGFFEGQTFYNNLVENIMYGPNLVLFLFLLSNVALKLFGPVACASHSWSVSVEEQFYLLWPWIVKYFSKVLLIILPCLVIIMNVVRLNIDSIEQPVLKAFAGTFYIDYMSTGGVLAVLFRKYVDKFNAILSRPIVIIMILFSVVMHLLSRITDITASITFGLLILVFVVNKISFRIFSEPGKWSYGIYMYHPLIMYLSFSLLHSFNIQSVTTHHVLIYVLVLGGTLGISFLSYRYIEMFFLRLKHRFSPVVSGRL